MIKFKDIKKDLTKVLSKRLVSDFQLIDGFVEVYIRSSIQAGLTIGGPNVPSVLVVDKNGELHFFAIKHLLPEISFE